MQFTNTTHSTTPPLRLWIGIFLVLAGEGFLLAAHRPISDFYFPLVWLGLTLVLDAAVYVQSGTSLFATYPRHVITLFGLSIGFWWLFEGFNVAVGSWRYVGAGRYTGLGYVIFASVDFSLVLTAVWEAATVVRLLLPNASEVTDDGAQPPPWVLTASVVAGVASLGLPIIAPHIFFGLIWVSLFFVIDPINARMGRPSLLVAVWNRRWRLPVSFALGALMCGFFWEAWNEWATPKWTYSIPYVGFWHIFEMPLLGWLGYLPFGLELFAMTNFMLPLLRLTPLTLEPFTGRRVDRVDAPAGESLIPGHLRVPGGIRASSHGSEIRRDDPESLRAT